MKFVSPYLNFNGNAEQAFDFYRSVFGGEFTGLVRFRDFPEGSMEISDDDLDKIAHISLPLAGDVSLMASDVFGPQAEAFRQGNSVYIYVEADSAEEADRFFSALSDDGQMEMPLQATSWAEKYGSCVDRFGVKWMISYTGDVRFQM